MDSVDATLEKYKGKEAELFRKLRAKYEPQPEGPRYPPPAGTGPRCYLEFSVGSEAARRVVVKLYRDKAPLAAENFRCLCTGEVTTRKASGKPLRYLGSKVHRIVPGFCLQAGDFTTGNGRGGASIYPPNSEHGDAWGKFRDEPAGFLDHSRKGLLSMANSGKDTNSSQFFFTLKAVPYLNGKHVVFGEVEEGSDVLEELGRTETDPKTQRPIRDVVISSCGEIDTEGRDRPSIGTTTGETAAASGPTPFGTGGSTMFGGGGAAFGTTTGGAATSLFGGGTNRGGGGGGSIFGGGGSGGTPAFGAPSSPGGGKSIISAAAPAFGAPSSLGGGAGSSATGSGGAPAFGSASALGGGNGIATTPAFGAPSSLGSGAGSSAIGSGGAFGSSVGGGGKPSSFGSGGTSAFGSAGASTTGGFAALASSSSSAGDGPVFGKTSAFGGFGGASSSSSSVSKNGPVFGAVSVFGGGGGGGGGGGFSALAASASTTGGSSPFAAFSGGGKSAFGGGGDNKGDSDPSLFSSAFGAATPMSKLNRLR